MRVVYLSLVFLFAREIGNVSLTSESGILNSARSPGNDWSSQSFLGSNFNPCDRAQSGAQNPQSACHNECLALKAEISVMYNANPNYRTNQLLNNMCGMVTEGKCSKGRYLVTDVQVGGKDVRALLDTGCDYTLIHPTLANEIVPVVGRAIFSTSGQQFQLLGTTTINVDIRRGVSISLTGHVIDKNYKIVFGTDFYVDHKAKIRIPEMKMDIVTNKIPVTMTLRFRPNPAGVNMMSTPNQRYTGLQIQAVVNGFDTRMLIDTGSTLTVVTSDFVAENELQATTMTASIGGGDRAGFKGATTVTLQIGTNVLKFPAVVPHFKPADNFLTGWEFNKRCVQLIDYHLRKVTLKFPSSSSSFTVPAFITRGQ